MLREKPGIQRGNGPQNPYLKTEFMLGVNNMQGNETRAFLLKTKPQKTSGTFKNTIVVNIVTKTQSGQFCRTILFFPSINLQRKKQNAREFDARGTFKREDAREVQPISVYDFSLGRS